MERFKMITSGYLLAVALVAIGVVIIALCIVLGEL